MLNKIFDPDNKFFHALGVLVDVVALSLLWVFLSLPIFTLGATTTALYDTVVKCLRREEVHPYRRFFTTFKENFKVATIAWVILAVFLFFLMWGYNIFRLLAEVEVAGGMVMFVAYCVLALVPVGWVCYVFPILSRFTFGVGGLLLASAKMALAHLPITVLLGAVTVEAVILSANYLTPMLIFPTLVTLFWSFSLEKYFAPFLPPEIEPAIDE